MKITKRKLKRIIREFVDAESASQQEEALLQEFEKNLNNTINQIPIALTKKVLSAMSQEEINSVIAFNKLDTKSKFKLIGDAMKELSLIKESKDDNQDYLDFEKEFKKQTSTTGLIKDMGQDVKDLLMGNPGGLRNASELNKLTKEELTTLHKSTSAVQSVRQGMIISALTLGIPIYTYLPQQIRMIGDTILQKVGVGAETPELYTPDPNVIYALFTAALLMTAPRVLGNEIQDRLAPSEGDEYLKRDISQMLYLDDPELPHPESGQKASSMQKIKMLLKNFVRFFWLN